MRPSLLVTSYLSIYLWRQSLGDKQAETVCTPSSLHRCTYLPASFSPLLSFPGIPGTVHDIFGSTQLTCTGSNCICTCTHQVPSTDPQSRLKQVRTKRNRTPSRPILNIQWHKDWSLPTYCTLRANQHRPKRFLSSQGGIIDHLRSIFYLPFLVLYAPSIPFS